MSVFKSLSGEEGMRLKLAHVKGFERRMGDWKRSTKGQSTGACVADIIVLASWSFLLQTLIQ